MVMDMQQYLLHHQIQGIHTVHVAMKEVIIVEKDLQENQSQETCHQQWGTILEVAVNQDLDLHHLIPRHHQNQGVCIICFL